MRLLFAVMLLIVFNSNAMAGYRYFYDGNGNVAGSANSFGKQTYYYGPNGEDAGSAMRAGNNTFYYDRNGNSVGSSTNIPAINKDDD